jgi:hypothetical protein
VEGARQGNAGTRSRSALQCSYCSTRSGRQHRVSALCTGVLLCHRRSIVKVSVAPQDYPTSCWRCLSEDAALHATLYARLPGSPLPFPDDSGQRGSLGV